MKTSLTNSSKCALSSKSTLICFAHPAESRFLKRIRPDLILLHTGMGAENAARSLRPFLKNRRPETIISAGFAGGLHPDHKVASLIFETEEKGLALHSALRNVKRGSFFSSDQIVSTSKQKKALWRRCKKDAVEMESATIHTFARQEKIPCITIRAISDAADDDLPLDFQGLMKGEMQLCFFKLFRTLILNPRKIPRLIRFRKGLCEASQKLAETISALVPD